ncbi:hypothetical protein N0V90_011203 [Kalmusia sp. IMI 367209]|nr:hypothetical protein N0V90_011203 [Kalmusia sp. IMI 367209]
MSSFTGELFENFMEYKQLLKLVADIFQNRDHYTVQDDKPNAISTDVPTLIAVRAALRNEMIKIVEAVDILVPVSFSLTNVILNWAITWGDTMISNDTVKMNIYRKAQAREKLHLGNELFGGDSMEGILPMEENMRECWSLGDKTRRPGD